MPLAAPTPPADGGLVEADDADTASAAIRQDRKPGAGGRVTERMNVFESTLSRLSARSRFFNRLFSLIWLPYAFRSGIRMKRVDASTFTAILPFKRFNRNWYNAMAGAALLANSEIAAGMYLFGQTGGGWSIVCKTLTYRFLRPCFGPAIYRVRPVVELPPLIAAGAEFNIELEIDVVQQIHAKRGKERRVGRSTAVFYVTPRSLRKTGKAKART